MTAKELIELGKKEYKIGGKKLTTVRCTLANKRTFMDLLTGFKSGESIMPMIEFLLLPKESVSQIDFENDVEIPELEEIVDDFLERATGRSAEQLNSLIGSVLQNPATLDSIIGRMNLSEKLEQKTGLPEASVNSTPSES